MAITEQLRPFTESVTSGVIEDLASVAKAPFGSYIVGPSEPLSAEARRLESSVFFETFGNTQEMLQAEYGPYEDASMFFVIVDHQRSCVAGMIRLVLDKNGVLKSLADIGSPPWDETVDHVLERTGLDDFDAAECMDVATLAVDPNYRGASGSLVSLALYRSVYQLSLAAELRWFIAILDVVVLDLIQSGFGAPFSHYAGVEPKNYLDSPSSVPVYCDFPAYVSRLRAEQPEIERILTDPEGIDEAVSPPDLDRAAVMLRQLTSQPGVGV